jgi:chloride channel 3/4/5
VRPFWTDESRASPEARESGKTSKLFDDRVWYDQFTSTDWVRDGIADAYRAKELRKRKDLRGRILAFFDGAQGWFLVAVIGCLTAVLAYVIDVTEAAIFDIKSGYCSTRWYYGKRQCCEGPRSCSNWRSWSSLIESSDTKDTWLDLAAFTFWVVLLAAISCLVTLQTKTEVSSAVALSTLDENLGAELHNHGHGKSDEGHDQGHVSPTGRLREAAKRPPTIYYPGAGSGVAEIKVILSGFVLHGYLGGRVLFFKAIGLVLSVASGMSIGKEGPYVHMATCIGNIASRISSKYRNNDAKRRELLSASAAAGVAVAFGSPLGGVLFSLEEVSYYFPPKTLFRTFFCCIAAALFLRFLNPYGTGKIVLFEVRYNVDWKIFEILAFIMLGVLGGAMGAFFIKASRLWAKTFRRVSIIKKYPIVEVLLVAVVTGLVTFWNRYTRLPVAELLYELAAPCDAFSSSGHGLCPTQENIPRVIRYLLMAFVIKAILTTVSFGIKVPAGIYVPSMVVGGLLGRIVGHSIQMLIYKYPQFPLFARCPVDGGPEACVVPGVYALVAAGATMCGVTRLSVTLAVILFELTGSLEHVLPFSLGVLIAKWTADAIEPLSVYDLLLEMNSYPFLDHKLRPLFDADIGEITAPLDARRYIDISDASRVSASDLRERLDYMHMAGHLDGGLPILRRGILVGLISGPDLEFALDGLEKEEDTYCLMRAPELWEQRPLSSTAGPDEHDMTASGYFSINADYEAGTTEDNDDNEEDHDPSDFTRYIDTAPMSLDISSPMELAFECFVKLGLRYICVLREGRFVGLVHRKGMTKYLADQRKQKGPLFGL